MRYEVFPFDASPERLFVVSDLMRRIAATPSVFSEQPCDAECIRQATLETMCDVCSRRMKRVAALLVAPDSRAWEVWRLGADAEPAGIVMLTDIAPGHDAIAHYIFFDERLGDKTTLLNRLIEWCFEDHPEEGWGALARITIEIPTPFAALARHASKRLGFGGIFPYALRTSEKPIRVEGVRRQAALWDGKLTDVLVLARLRSAPAQTRAASVPTTEARLAAS